MPLHLLCKCKEQLTINWMLWIYCSNDLDIMKTFAYWMKSPEQSHIQDECYTLSVQGYIHSKMLISIQCEPDTVGLILLFPYTFPLNEGITQQKKNVLLSVISFCWEKYKDVLNYMQILALFWGGIDPLIPILNHP